MLPGYHQGISIKPIALRKDQTDDYVFEIDKDDSFYKKSVCSSSAGAKRND